MESKIRIINNKSLLFVYIFSQYLVVEEQDIMR